MQSIQMSATCILLLLSLAAAVKGDEVLVTVQQGTLRGTTATSVYNTSYTAFLGIPYAEPPVGDLRFEPPQAASGWEGVRNATEYGSDCVQETGEGSEDCLYLNVYVPGAPQEGAGLPVLFYVHGGGFVRGSGSDQKFGPDFLVSYGVILVTINYRLGPLGFLSTRDVVIAGNAGLKDQLLALSWVQSNIARFGGDPQRVTLDGRSAGGDAVSLHLTSPLTAAASGWEGVRNATEYGSDCVQETGEGSEDCLYLNVYVPGAPQEGAGLPVLFYVHGGGFVRGSGSDQKFGPDFLVSYGVILVTINYRLGPLGFLSTRDVVIAGNAGLKDQLLALSWVQSNIARFGGDPQRVTLDGRSAGGDAVSLHLTSPLTAGLFSQLVDQSGTFVARMSLVRDARHHAFALGSVLGYEAENSQQLVEFLRSVNATDLLVDQSLLMTDEEKLYFSYNVWAPTIEPDIEGAFVRESPIRTVSAGTFNRVPIMIGVTSIENGANILNETDVVANLKENFEAVVGPCLHLQTTNEQTQAALTVRNFYFGNETISLDNPEPLVQLKVDIDFFNPTDALVRKIVEVTDLPVYYYEFDYRGENVPTNEWGVEHGGEQGFLFLHYNNDLNYNLDPQSEEDQVRRNMLRLWTNFVKYGNPTPEADPVVWEPYNLTNRSYLLMQANFTLAHNRLGERMDFWNDNVPLEAFPGTY